MHSSDECLANKLKSKRCLSTSDSNMQHMKTTIANMEIINSISANHLLHHDSQVTVVTRPINSRLLKSTLEILVCPHNHPTSEGKTKKWTSVLKKILTVGGITFLQLITPCYLLLVAD